MEEFIDSNFNKGFTQQYHLLIEIDTQQISFALVNKDDLQISVLKRLLITKSVQNSQLFELIKNLINEEDLLHLPVKEIRISYSMSPFVLVPEQLFDPSKSKAYLEYSAHLTNSDAIALNSISNSGIKNIFSIDENFQRYLYSTFKNCLLFHSTTPLLEFCNNRRQTFAGAQLILELRQNFFHIMYYEKGKLHFANQFRYSSKEDFIYFVLLVCDQLNIDRNICELLLTGFIHQESQLYNELYKFFKNISFASFHQYAFQSKSLIPEHYYISLLSLDLCAS